jgi:type II secretory pathway pseudopilin PulG
MREGWTVIELIFIIVILGLLAGIALPRLASTRDDAKLSVVVHNMNVCIRDAEAYYTATGHDYNATSHPEACNPNNTICNNLTYSINGMDFNVTTNPTAENFCTDIDEVGGHLARSYSFGGQGIKR